MRNKNFKLIFQYISQYLCNLCLFRYSNVIIFLQTWLYFQRYIHAIYIKEISFHCFLVLRSYFKFKKDLNQRDNIWIFESRIFFEKKSTSTFSKSIGKLPLARTFSKTLCTCVRLCVFVYIYNIHTCIYIHIYRPTP